MRYSKGDRRVAPLPFHLFACSVYQMENQLICLFSVNLLGGSSSTHLTYFSLIWFFPKDILDLFLELVLFFWQKKQTFVDWTFWWLHYGMVGGKTIAISRKDVCLRHHIPNHHQGGTPGIYSGHFPDWILLLRIGLES